MPGRMINNKIQRSLFLIFVIIMSRRKTIQIENIKAREAPNRHIWSFHLSNGSDRITNGRISSKKAISQPKETGILRSVKD